MRLFDMLCKRDMSICCVLDSASTLFLMAWMAVSMLPLVTLLMPPSICSLYLSVFRSMPASPIALNMASRIWL
ncbi:hypothetical protein D3C72_1766000 [compost metagenome]